jgi:hypothetical protein
MSNERANAGVTPDAGLRQILTATLKARNLDSSVIERVRGAVAREWLAAVCATRSKLSTRHRQRPVPKM